MAGSLNKVLLIGRLGNDPEIKQMQNGKSVARLSVATSESWKDKNSGEKKEKTEWHRVVIFNEGLVNVVQQYLKQKCTQSFRSPARAQVLSFVRCGATSPLALLI